VDVAGLLLLDDKLPQCRCRNPRKKDISSKDGQPSVEIHSILLSKNPKYRKLAHEILLKNGERTVDKFVSDKNLFIQRYFNYELFRGNAVTWL